MKESIGNVNTICDCLSLLGCNDPFITNGSIPTEELTNEGCTAYHHLREIILFLKRSGVVGSFDEDRLDEKKKKKGY